MRRLLPLVLVLGLGAVPATAADGTITVKGEDGTSTFTPVRDGDGPPGVSYDTPSQNGGHFFVAVGGWAVEAELAPSGDQVVLYGAAVRAARTIRVGRLAKVRTRPFLAKFGVRYFAAIVPRAALKLHPNKIAAYDAKGRLLGRQHYSQGKGFGACDGRYDRRHICKKG